MKYSKIKNLEQLQSEKALISRQLAQSEKKLDTKFIIAKRHTKDLLSFPLMIKRVVGSILSLDTILSNPALMFKAGSALGKRLFAKK
ncbi:MAG: hypothetical protein MJ003_03420 [Paludibacteraceae bacterium]|nr:hypothetical protein [Paludibacteraceae bacterium]